MFSGETLYVLAAHVHLFGYVPYGWENYLICPRASTLTLSISNFSQSLSTLNVIEEFLAKCEVPSFPGRQTDPLKPTRWMKNKSYFRKLMARVPNANA